jgi:hypothetical protein
MCLSISIVEEREEGNLSPLSLLFIPFHHVVFLDQHHKREVFVLSPSSLFLLNDVVVYPIPK